MNEKKAMKDQTVADFPIGSSVWISFSDIGEVVGHTKVECREMRHEDPMLVVWLVEAPGAKSATGMEYRLVLVHPQNITSTHRMPRADMRRYQS
ncbi:MAG: hypothetical protein ACO1Q7_02005 [Gemmatimonas sp.]